MKANISFFPNFVITIRIDGEKVFAQATGQGEFEIFPQSENKFYYKVVNAQIEFVPDDNGEFNKLIFCTRITRKCRGIGLIK